MGFYFENWSSDIIAGLVLIVGVAYVYMKLVVFQYWKRLGVPAFEPSFPLGNFAPVLLQKMSIGELIENLYNKSTDRFVGLQAITKPLLILRDPDLIRAVFIKDFAYFADRGVHSNEKTDPLSANLFSMKGEKWKNLRTKLSPVFTSGKLKAMFSTILDCGESLQKFMDNAAKNEDVVEVREIAARFTTDIIASVAFGMEINSMENPNTAFRRYGRKAFELSLINGVRVFIMFIMPVVQKLLKLKTIDDGVEEFMMNMVKQTIEHREKNNVTRKDLFQLLIQLRNTGYVQKDGDWETKIQKDESDKKLTFNELAAQAWLFYIAGFETASSTISFCLFELAKNQHVQRKVQKEMDEVSARHINQITYESLAEMKYLEACIDETLRKYPIIPILNRECTKAYTIPGTNTIIEKGTAIIIPVLGLQRDPKYYPNPMNFEPERFLKGNTSDKSFAEMPYMPFGEGPRGCPGTRMGKVQVKVGLILMLQKSNFELQKNAPLELQISPKGFVMSAVGGINLKVKTRGYRSENLMKCLSLRNKL